MQIILLPIYRAHKFNKLRYIQLWFWISITVPLLFTKLNFITIIKSISIFQRFVLNYKFHHNANFKKDSITIFFKKSSVNFENLLLNQSKFFKDSFYNYKFHHNFKKDSIIIFFNEGNHPSIFRIFHNVLNFFFSFFALLKSNWTKLFEELAKIRIATRWQSRPVTRSSNSGRHSANRFLLSLSAGSLPYDIRFDFFFISVLPNGAAAKQRGRAPGAGVTCTGSFVSALLFLRAHHPIPPSPRSLPPFHNFPFLLHGARHFV